MRLSVILKDIEKLNNFVDTDITDICDNSEKVTPGSVFVCIKGKNFDGHTAAGEALAKGANALVVERDLGFKEQVIVKNSREAFSYMCGAFFGRPDKKLKIIGITGTNGKTSVSVTLKSIFDNLGIKCGLIGSIKKMIDGKELPATLTSPESYELNRLFAEMAENGCEYCVMEVSSQALAQKRVAGITFEAGVFTNITQDHLDYHETFENYLEAKKELFNASKLAIINADDKNADNIIESMPENCRCVTYSILSDMAAYTAKNINYKPGSVEYEFVGQYLIGRVKFNIPGEFSVYNSMAAVVAAVEMGLDFKAVLDAAEKTEGVKGRVEIIPNDRGITIVIDYAHTPDALRNVIETLKKGAQGRVITLFGCGGDRDNSKRPIMGGIAADLSDFVVVTSDNPRTEDPETIIDEITANLKRSRTLKIITDRREAIKFALAEANEGDTVLLAGKGHETYQILKEGKIDFDEREIVKQELGYRN
ncbi:MAG: UDP-N-acetylmuramoyl-L-alanyl-D-glutamate--2,6-diaminopimelate ligase [Oscillospiraceae bacterium]|nr:UDP-N-acetylmuramoyl-L-alanyl-D-glutamate--2,6-diaminopimelate ligase [Oscillospiraceae bacterium]